MKKAISSRWNCDCPLQCNTVLIIENALITFLQTWLCTTRQWSWWSGVGNTTVNVFKLSDWLRILCSAICRGGRDSSVGRVLVSLRVKVPWRQILYCPFYPWRLEVTFIVVKMWSAKPPPPPPTFQHSLIQLQTGVKRRCTFDLDDFMQHVSLEVEFFWSVHCLFDHKTTCWDLLQLCAFCP